jgi:endonuclease YncB( thermonuclease family)|tara:strand:+ start:7766 stop:8065 length:300 start_codon:yes stop_codon:yes gene_type:complete
MYIYKGFLVRIVNAGLVRITLDLGFGVMLSSMPVRLIGIKTREGIEGEKAVDYLTNLLPMTFTVKTKLDDNMILGEIMTQGESINQKMLDSGLVDKYGE